MRGQRRDELCSASRWASGGRPARRWGGALVAGLLAVSLAGCSSSGAATTGGATSSTAAPAKSAAASNPAGSSSATSSLAPGSARETLQVGDAAPDVTFTFADGSTAPLSSFKGQVVLVYFYPQDDTKGCTMEAEGIRDVWADFQAANVKVIGVSMQDAASHNAFTEKYKLPFPLAVDVDGSLATAFKVPISGQRAQRQSFLVGKDGKLAAVWLRVDPSVHAADVLTKAKGA